jgi:HEAT repeat protein
LRQQIRIAAVLTALVAAFGLASARAQDWDKKTIEKMLNEGTKKLSSADPKEREDGAGYILGYIRCSDRPKFVPILTKALKDPNPKVRVTVVQTFEKIQAAEAIPDLLPLLDDPVDDVAERTAYTLGGLGAAAKSAEPGLRKAAAARKAQKKSTLAMTMEEAIKEIEGKADGKRYSCEGK